MSRHGHAQGKPAVLVAARMSSSRLPGKMLMNFGDRPLLSHVVEAASLAEGTSRLVVVTSVERSDDPIAKWCGSNAVEVWRGQLNDVAGRMIEAAEHVSAESFVRISGDSPMIDPKVISFAVQLFERSMPDLVTNIRPRTFPAGQSVEVVRTQTLRRLLKSGESQDGDREHVTPALYRQENEIEIVRFAPSDMNSGASILTGPYMSLTVDTPEDAECFRRVIRDAGDAGVWMRGWQQCEAMMRAAEQQLQGAPGGRNA